jgi:hypothetical protein
MNASLESAMAKDTGTANAAGAKRARCQEKADVLFVMYQQMGPERSLEMLARVCAKVGLRGCALNTLKRYSVMFDWQRRLLELTVRLREERETDTLQQIDKMNEQHIKVNQGLLSLGVAGIQYYQQEIQRKQAQGLPANFKFNIQDIVRLVAQAQTGERLARGQATSRSEVMVEVIGTFVHEFALVFIAVNDIADPVERKREYIRRTDEMLREYYSNLTGPAIKQSALVGERAK